MKMNFITAAVVIVCSATIFTGCKTVYPGEVGVLIRKGKIEPGILTQGRHHYNPFTAKICKLNTRISEFSATMSPPTKEGLEVKVDLTVLYHVRPEAAPAIYANVGLDFGKKIVINNFMAIVREYTMKYTAIELLNERETIEKNIEDKLKEAISAYGIILDDVLVKDIDMPTEVLHAIENKAKAEQIAKQTKLELQTKRDQEDFDIESKEKELKFALKKQKNDSLMMQIDAYAIKNYQLIINQALTDRFLKFKSIEITKELVKSPNAKIIITNGKTMMLNSVGEK
jgi:regulator of protease activity HflC (stomatin/prohibitin superfamily)